MIIECSKCTCLMYDEPFLWVLTKHFLRFYCVFRTLFSTGKLYFVMCLTKTTKYNSPVCKESKIINFDEVDFSECSSKEEKCFFWLSVYVPRNDEQRRYHS